jgi:hypothetical protein
MQVIFQAGIGTATLILGAPEVLHDMVALPGS